MIKLLTPFLLIISFFTSGAFGQAHSSMGFALGANHTLNKYDHTLNASFALLGNVRVVNKLAIEPSIGIREVSDYVSAVYRLSIIYQTRYLLPQARFFGWAAIFVTV